MLSDEPKEFGSVEPGHQHEVVTHQQADRRDRHAGVVAQRDGDQLDVALLRAHSHARERAGVAAVAARLDELGPAGAATGSQRFPRR